MRVFLRYGSASRKERASYVTGVALPVDGGCLAR
jgi:NAD(P)-dependent dehydrogenase (short-subunit alcohol dehydrogenase family)